VKIFLFLTTLFFSAAWGWSQQIQIAQDPLAGQVLDRVAQKTIALQSMQSDFELIIEDRKENKRNASAGNLIMKQKKYKLTSDGSIVFFDGLTMWTYLSAANEVTVTEPGNNSIDFMSSPSTFFASYKKEFKYKYVRENTINGVACHEIDLFPKNLNQPYSRIKVFINKTTDLPETISSIGKDGVDYTINLKNIILNRDIPDATFTFDPAKYKKVEVVDMRGL